MAFVPKLKFRERIRGLTQKGADTTGGTPGDLPPLLPLPDDGGGAALSFAATEAGERLSANLRLQLNQRRDLIDFARQRQQTEADVMLQQQQLAQDRELEQKSLTQARAKLFVSMIGKDVGRAILFALSSKGGG